MKLFNDLVTIEVAINLIHDNKILAIAGTE